MRRLLFLLAVATLAEAQTAITTKTARCGTDAPAVAMTLPVNISPTTAIPVPICAAIGGGVRLNTAVSPPRLEVDPATLPPAPDAPAVPRQAMKKVIVGNVLPPAVTPGTTISFNLEYEPAPGTFMVVVFQSSRVGGNTVEIISPGGGASPKRMDVALPHYAPYTSSDVLTVLYWTMDAP